MRVQPERWIELRGVQMVPRISYADVQRGLSEEQITRVRETGTVIVTGGVPKEVRVCAFDTAGCG